MITFVIWSKVVEFNSEILSTRRLHLLLKIWWDYPSPLNNAVVYQIQYLVCGMVEHVVQGWQTIVNLQPKDFHRRLYKVKLDNTNFIHSNPV